MKPTLTLVRGVPGSGKSTLAKLLKHGFSDSDVRHYEADMYFTDPQTGIYTFDPRGLHRAHDWCQKMSKVHLYDGYNVIVSNTFVKLWEMEPYFQMANEHGASVQVILSQGNFKNVHGVTDVKVKQMRDRFEYDVSPLFERFK